MHSARCFFSNIEPHYLVGIAQLRSGISDDSHGDRIGPYQLTQAEWDANSNDDEFELHFTSLQINSPTRQCAVFGLMTQRAFHEFHSAANGRNPSAKELYLKQWPDAATDGLQKALDDTADLIGPAADAVLDEPELVDHVTAPDQEALGPAPKFGPDPVPNVPVGPDTTGAMLTLALLKKRWPSADAGLIAGMVANAGVLSRLGINTPLRMAHFMGQISQECGRGTETVESLNYSAARMMKVFPKRFPDLASTRGSPIAKWRLATKCTMAAWAIGRVPMTGLISVVAAASNLPAATLTIQWEKAVAWTWLTILISLLRRQISFDRRD